MVTRNVLSFCSAKALSQQTPVGAWFMYLVHPCDTALRPHECLAVRPIVGEVERGLPNGMLKWHLPSAELDCVQTDGRSHHPYRRDECNSELCCVPSRSPYGSPLLIILLKLASLASQNRNFQFITLF